MVDYQLRIGRIGTGVDDRLPKCALERLQCHFLVDSIPDEGLPKICEMLGDLAEDYTERPYIGPRISNMGSVPMVPGMTYERPSLEYSED